MTEIAEHDFYGFFLRAVMPAAKAKLPCGLEESNLLWDAVWRAHRDVAQARSSVKEYNRYGKRPWASPSGREPNIIPARLYEILDNWPQGGEPLGSRALIGLLREPFERNGKSVDLSKAELFGPVQKLVNMTLKYLVMLQAFHCSDESIDKLPAIPLDMCDCPLDSVILDSLGGKYREMRWTRITREEYEEAQERIAGDPRGPGLAYDLKVWPGETCELDSEE